MCAAIVPVPWRAEASTWKEPSPLLEGSFPRSLLAFSERRAFIFLFFFLYEEQRILAGGVCVWKVHSLNQALVSDTAAAATAALKKKKKKYKEGAQPRYAHLVGQASVATACVCSLRNPCQCRSIPQPPPRAHLVWRGQA